MPRKINRLQMLGTDPSMTAGRSSNFLLSTDAAGPGFCIRWTAKLAIRYFPQPIRFHLPHFFKICPVLPRLRPLKVQVLVWRMFPFRVVL